MESRNEKERYITNPLRLMRCAVELGRMTVSGLLNKVDNAMEVDFNPSEYYLPIHTEAPVATEEELMDDNR